MNFILPEKIEYVLKKLKSSGFEAYIVGGCVRDSLMGIVPHDYDVTTSATPDEVQKIFERTVATGIKHGTVTVLCGKTPVEVTTFRTEGEYSDCRRPDSVEFVTDIKYDLSRRDFTVNAMAYNSADGLVDLFGGRQDLENCILRAVGDPEKRFCEDALRILRLFRFASVLDFKIEENTLAAALKHAVLLKNVSCERIFAELSKAVCGKSCIVLEKIINTGALSFLGIEKCGGLEKLSLLPENPRLRLFAFLYFCECDIKSVLCRLKASNAQKKYCKDLNQLCSVSLTACRTDLKYALSIFGEEILYDYLEFIKVIKNTDISKIKDTIDEILKLNEPYLIEHLAIDGNDLKDLGFSGKEISDGLTDALDFVIEHPNRNTKAEIIRFLSN